MDFLTENLLTILILLPVIGALAVVAYQMFAKGEDQVKWITLGITVVVFLLSLILLIDNGVASASGFYFEKSIPWISAINTNYHVGVDGLSLWLVILTTFIMSGTYSDFDYYSPAHLASFRDFIHSTKISVLAICGSHQLVGMSFDAELKTLDDLDLDAKRSDRVIEYQYRFVKIVDRSDPIFDGIDDEIKGIWQDYTREDDILRVWQNHGVQVVGVPAGFKLLATSYRCRNQMMVKHSDGQMIYGVQFHLEKSFEDWSKNPTRWEHPNDSRDGRILFENFLKLALNR